MSSVRALRKGMIPGSSRCTRAPKDKKSRSQESVRIASSLMSQLGGLGRWGIAYIPRRCRPGSENVTCLQELLLVGFARGLLFRGLFLGRLFYPVEVFLGRSLLDVLDHRLPLLTLCLESLH